MSMGDPLVQPKRDFSKLLLKKEFIYIVWLWRNIYFGYNGFVFFEQICCRNKNTISEKMKIVTSLSLLVYAVFVKSLSNSQRLLVDLFVNDVSCYVNCLSKLVTELYVEKKSFLYSTGKDNFDKEYV